MQDRRYATPGAELEGSPAGTRQGPVGLGGWLILVVLGLVISPLRIGHLLLTSYFPMFTDGTWQYLTEVGSPGYHPLWAPVMVFEVTGNLLLIALAAITLVCFFLRSRYTPRLAIGWYAFAAIFVTIDFFVADLIPAVAAEDDAESLKEMLRSLIAALIWIPYFLVSTRVRNTFVR